MRRALVAAVLALGCGQGPPAAGVEPARTRGYPGLRAAIEGERIALAAAYATARHEPARRAVRERAIAVLTARLVDAVLPAWDGTAWAMNGTTEAPGRGAIACGYFVSTALRDAGLRVERARLGQQAAEDIIRSLVPAARVRRFSRAPLAAFVAAVAAQGDGLYVVGLDYHVGFLVVDQGRVWFHHSSYVNGRQVLREAALGSESLARSQYRVVGKLFTGRRLIEAWLGGAPIATVRSRG